MTKIPFRNHTPTRTYTGPELRNYRDYKKYLEKDFQQKCGYTNCSHWWFGGEQSFQIDHFIPKSRRPDLTTKYFNLVYSCSYVNRAKSNDDGNYLDPCNVDLNLHFYRDEFGKIYPEPSSSQAVYMYKKLKLFLQRYSLIFLLDQLEIQIEKLGTYLNTSTDPQIKQYYIEANQLYHQYKKRLRAEL